MNRWIDFLFELNTLFVIKNYSTYKCNVYIRSLFSPQRTLEILSVCLLKYVYFRIRDISIYIYCYNYLNKVYIDFEKSNLPIEEARIANRVPFFFCTLRPIDVFTDAGIRSHSLHFINLDGISNPLYIRPDPVTAHADAGFGPRFAAACFAYVTSSILLGIRRHAGTSWIQETSDMGLSYAGILRDTFPRKCVMYEAPCIGLHRF